MVRFVSVLDHFFNAGNTFFVLMFLFILVRKYFKNQLMHIWKVEVGPDIGNRFMYLVALMDCATRERLSNPLDSGFCVEALNEALS